MARSHPPTLLTLAGRTLEEECGVARGECILVAVSGGPDSMALLHVLARLAPKHGFSVTAHGVNHGLRPEASAELELAQKLARSLDVPFARTDLQLAAGGNLQARARAARYAALEVARASAGAHYIATAHHADDRAETVLLRLLRGAGPRGLAALPARAGNRIRPLLRARRSDVLTHLDRHALTFATDASNHDRRFQRVRVREEVLPLLTELSPGIVNHLNHLADKLALAPAADDGARLATIVTADGAVERLDSVARLGRAQRDELARALRSRGSRAHIWLANGAEARVFPGEGGLAPRNAPGLTHPSAAVAERKPRRKATLPSGDSD
jgi:tRNA(Ile)-lysidine synthase